MTRVYLVRHGEAEGNLLRVFQGHTDGALTNTGKAQIQCLTKRFEPIHLDAIYSSDLQRAYQTALAIRGEKPLEVEIDTRLREIYGGDWEGHPWDELPQLWPEIYEIWTNRIDRVHLPGGESMEQVERRIVSTIHELVSKNKGKTIAIASHGTAIRAFLCHEKGWPLCEIGNMVWHDNTSVSVIDYDEQMRPVVSMEGDISHLSDELSTLKRQTWWKK